jgi:hypothetical protein
VATRCNCGGKTITVKPKRANGKKVSGKKVSGKGSAGKGASKGKAASARSKALSKQATRIAKKNAKGCNCTTTGGSQ